MDIETENENLRREVSLLLEIVRIYQQRMEVVKTQYKELDMIFRDTDRALEILDEVSRIRLLTPIPRYPLTKR
jgi:prefoldin subunit 5